MRCDVVHPSINHPPLPKDLRATPSKQNFLDHAIHVLHQHRHHHVFHVYIHFPVHSQRQAVGSYDTGALSRCLCNFLFLSCLKHLY